MRVTCSVENMRDVAVIHPNPVGPQSPHAVWKSVEDRPCMRREQTSRLPAKSLSRVRKLSVGMDCHSSALMLDGVYVGR
jgi:hypothetical protein